MNTHKPSNKKLTFLDFELLDVKNETKQWSSDTFETVFVIIEGSCTITVENQSYTMNRINVFDNKPSAVFGSPGTKFTITSQTSALLALCKSKATKKFPSIFVSANSIKKELRGKNGYKRKIYNIINTETQTNHIALGETINMPGQWSSFPPHKHDTYVENKENPLEEIYYFRIRPETGFGFQRIYTQDLSVDKTLTIHNGDCVHLPCGYHPVANMPKHDLYYLWMLAGEKRIYNWNTDPNFSWLL